MDDAYVTVKLITCILFTYFVNFTLTVRQKSQILVSLSEKGFNRKAAYCKWIHKQKISVEPGEMLHTVHVCAASYKVCIGK